MITLSYTTEHIKSINRLSLFEGTTAELFRFLLKSKRVITDKLGAGYFTRCVINGARNNENAADTASILILDCDSQINPITGEIISGAVNPIEVHWLLNHLKLDHLITSSFSNTTEVRKYRVVIPCHYTRQQLVALLDWIFERFHENGVMLANVKENATWAQGFFIPSVHADRQHLFKRFWRVDGKSSNPLRDDTEIEFLRAEPFDVARIVADYENKKPKLIPTPERLTMPKGAIVTAVNPIQFFNGIHTAHDVLTRNGYKQTARNRYLHQNSTSGVAGVRILENGRVYSDSNDPLNCGKALDSFDVMRLLECGGDMKQALNWNSEITKANRRAFYEVPADTAKPRDISIGAVSQSDKIPLE